MDELQLIRHLDEAPRNLFWLPVNIRVDSLSLPLRSGRLDGSLDEALRHLVFTFIHEMILSANSFGFGIIRIEDVEDLTDDALADRFKSLMLLLGRPMPQNSNGDLFYHVENKVSGSNSLRLSATAGRTSLHTDCTYGNIRPNFVSLGCIRQSSIGGDSLICSFYTALEMFISEHGDQLKELMREFYFDRRGSGIDLNLSTAGLYRIFALENNLLNIRYKRPYMDSGHTAMQIPIPERAKEELDYLDEILSRSICFSYKLKRGELLVITNKWVLHDRVPYRDLPKIPKRNLLRAWHRN